MSYWDQLLQYPRPWQIDDVELLRLYDDTNNLYYIFNLYNPHRPCVHELVDLEPNLDSSWRHPMSLKRIIYRHETFVCPRPTNCRSIRFTIRRPCQLFRSVDDALWHQEIKK